MICFSLQLHVCDFVLMFVWHVGMYLCLFVDVFFCVCLHVYLCILCPFECVTLCLFAFAHWCQFECLYICVFLYLGVYGGRRGPKSDSQVWSIFVHVHVSFYLHPDYCIYEEQHEDEEGHIRKRLG